MEIRGGKREREEGETKREIEGGERGWEREI